MSDDRPIGDDEREAMEVAFDGFLDFEPRGPYTQREHFFAGWKAGRAFSASSSGDDVERALAAFYDDIADTTEGWKADTAGYGDDEPVYSLGNGFFRVGQLRKAMAAAIAAMRPGESAEQ